MDADTGLSVNSAIMPATGKDRSWWACVFYLKCVDDGDTDYVGEATDVTILSHICIL